MRKEREGYPSDVSDEEWALVVAYLTLMRETAPQREYSLRAVFNALRWMARAGAAWRMLPHDFPPWDTVYGYFSRWRKAGLWEQIHQQLYSQMRGELGRELQASAAVADSQSVKTTEKGA